MKKRKPLILVADKISDEGVELMASRGLDPVVEQGLSDAALKKWLQKADGVVVRSATKIRAGVLSGKTKIKVIGRAGIGVDNIDVDAVSELGIVVLNTPDSNAATTAELAIAHMFSLARRLAEADASVRAGKWERSKFMGVEIAGKTIGVLGYGTIGRIVASRCQGLAMDVLVHDPFVADSVIEEDGGKPATLAQLLKKADFVSIHAPGNKETMGLIGEKELRRMKSGAHLIQCARGGIVDERALAKALDKGWIAGAAVDVFTSEPPKRDNPLLGAPRIVFTPHLGASTTEAQKATGLSIAEQLAVYFETGEAVNSVNMPRIPADVLEKSRPYLPLAKGLGRLISAMSCKRPDELEVTLHGQAADITESVLVAEVLAGILSPSLSIPVNQVNAITLAERQGLKIAVVKDHSAKEFATLLEVKLRCGKQIHSVAGTLLGGAQPRIAHYDGIELEAPLSGPVLLTSHKDRPGVVAELAGVLADLRINISHMHVGSDPKGKRAVACLRLDKMLADDVVDRICRIKNIDNAIHLSL